MTTINILAPRHSVFAQGLVRALRHAGVDVRAADYRAPMFTLWQREPLSSSAPTVALRGERINGAVWAALNGPKIVWNCENLTPDRIEEIRKLAPHCNRVWYHIDAPHVADAMKQAGVESWDTLSCAWADPDDWGGGGEVERHTHDVTFVGWNTPRREKILNELRRRGLRVLQAMEFNSHRAGSLFRRSPVVLNLHAEEMVNTETRVAEVAAAGGALLSEKTTDASGDWAELTDWPTNIDALELMIRGKHARQPTLRTFDALVPQMMDLIEGVA